MIVALFDFDGTLVTKSVWPVLLRALWRRRVNRLPLGVHLLVHYPLYPLVRLGLLSEDRFRSLWAEHMPWLLWRMSISRADELFREVAQILSCNIRRSVADRLRWHQAQGHTVVLLSAAFAPLLRSFAQLFDVEHVVGTELAIHDGYYTGAAIPPVCMGKAKLARIQEYVHGLGFAVDWASSYAYGDSYTDELVLRSVGHPIAVSPDERLAKVAKICGWPIIE